MIRIRPADSDSDEKEEHSKLAAATDRRLRVKALARHRTPRYDLRMAETTLGVDRSALEVRDSFSDTDDCTYWWSRTPQERLIHVQRLRRLNHGDRAAGRLQRVLEIAELAQR